MKININSPFAIIQKLDSDQFLYLSGEMQELDNIAQIKIPSTQDYSNKEMKYTSLSMIPFHQAYEKGYKVHKSNDKILSLEVKFSTFYSFKDILQSFSWKDFTVQDLAFEISNAQYRNLVQKIIKSEIANGEGCNFVIPRKIEGNILDLDIHQALTIFASLIKRDYGTYWKFIFYTGDRFFIGSTPERHLEIIDDEVRMNPVSGTLFKQDYFSNKELFKKDLIKFLNDTKEINELFMVLEEELKMMCKITKKGGMVIGPILKEMSKLIHTEYLLNGIYDKTEFNILDILRESFFATTVTGSPLANAFNIIHKYENSSRKYYGSSIVLIGQNNEGKSILDSPILIRTLDINKSGQVSLGVGSTLVKDSNATKELEETFVKSEALLNSLYQSNELQTPRVLSNCMNDDDIHLNLHQRNQKLSKFWFFQQHLSVDYQPFFNKTIMIINNGDDFCYMLAHLLSKMGLKVKITNYTNFKLDKDIHAYIIGPGPGNPNNINDYRMSQIAKIISQIQNYKFLAICLGHQVLCNLTGFYCQKLDIPMQGEKKLVKYFGKQYFLGFYNTFIPMYNKLKEYVSDLEFSLDENNNILAMRGSNFASMQFHPESILSECGYDILKQELKRIL